MRVIVRAGPAAGLQAPCRQGTAAIRGLTGCEVAEPPPAAATRRRGSCGWSCRPRRTRAQARSVDERWRELLPDRLGDLQLGGDLVRTDPNGDPAAPILVLGAYPAVTKVKRFSSVAGPRLVPTAVE